MTAPTSVVPTAAGALSNSTHRQSAFERWYERHGAGRRFVLTAAADGRCFLTDVLASDDSTLTAAGRELALLSSVDLHCCVVDGNGNGDTPGAGGAAVAASMSAHRLSRAE